MNTIEVNLPLLKYNLGDKEIISIYGDKFVLDIILSTMHALSD